MRIVQGSAHGQDHTTGLVRSEAVPGEPRPQRPARHQLHDEKAEAVPLDVVVDGDDVGMVERGDELRLGHEPGLDGRVGGKSARQLLDGDPPPKGSVLTLEHDTPRAPPDLLAQVVARKGVGDQPAVQRHECGR